jgi:hypothetical protein
LAFLAPLHFQEDRISPTESTFYPQLAANESFVGTTSAKASFFTHNPYSLSVLAATSTQ